MENKIKLILIFILSSMLIVLVGVSHYFSNTSGEDKTNVSYANYLDTICLDGHVYYYGQSGYKGYLAFKGAILLDSSGKPIKCMAK